MEKLEVICIFYKFNRYLGNDENLEDIFFRIYLILYKGRFSAQSFKCPNKGEDRRTQAVPDQQIF